MFQFLVQEVTRAGLIGFLALVVSAMASYYAGRLWHADRRASRSAHITVYSEKTNQGPKLFVTNHGRSSARDVSIQFAGTSGPTIRIAELEAHGKRVVEIGPLAGEARISLRDESGKLNEATRDLG